MSTLTMQPAPASGGSVVTTAPFKVPITGRMLITKYRDPMVDRLIKEHKIDPERAALMIDNLFDRLRNRVMTDHGINAAEATRTTDQAVLFVGACANGARDLGPSQFIDRGWHTFQNYSLEYEVFGWVIGETFVHHLPSDLPGVDYGDGDLAPAVAALEALNYQVDRSAWFGNADCSNHCSGWGGSRSN